MADEKKRNKMALRLPFGLCKRYGITLSKDATPRQAWDALRRGTGKTPQDVFAGLKAKDGYLGDRDAKMSAEEKENTQLSSITIKLRKNNLRQLIQEKNAVAQYFYDHGIDRYSMPKVPQISSTAEDLYYKIADKIAEYGDNATQRGITMSKKTQEQLKEYVEALQIRHMNRIYLIDEDIEKRDPGDDLERYKKQERVYKKMLDLLSTPWATKKEQESWRKVMEIATKRKKEQGQREITSSTYERAMARQTRNLNSWFGRGM